MRTTIFALALIACGTPSSSNTIADQQAFNAGEQFYLAASYRITEAKAENHSFDLDDNHAEFGDLWTSDLYWSFQVVESGMVPTADDELYPYAELADSVASLSVVRAWLDEDLNAGQDLLEQAPVIYLVFREDHNRLAAVVSYTFEDGERVSRAWSSLDLDHSYNTLSQSMMTLLPTYLAPAAASFEDNSIELENGTWMDTTLVDPNTVDVHYEDAVGGGMVISRYESGVPWPTQTVSDTVDARLMTADDVAAMRSAWGAAPPPPEDLDYRAALRQTIDIDNITTLDILKEVGTENVDVVDREYAVPVEYRPWAGNWWPLKTGKLVFGYRAADTLSDRIKDDIQPIAEEIDTLSAELRDLDRESSEYGEKVETYKTKRQELVDKLVEFYDGVYNDLDGGKLRIEDGQLTHDDGWSYEIDELSTFDKFAVAEYLAGNTRNNPFYLSAWELLNQWNPAGESWWGHCNGWAAAAILTNEPREARTVSVGGEDIEFSTADIKGLLTEAHYSTMSSFYGTRYNGEDDDVSDLTPTAFHSLISFYLGDLGVPFVFDITATEAVWNYPVMEASVTMYESTSDSYPADWETLVNVNTASAAELETLNGIGPALAGRIIDYRMRHGKFASPSDLVLVSGIGETSLSGFVDMVVTEPIERVFDVTTRVTITEDGVGETHIDGDYPNHSIKTWSYTLTTDRDGALLRGEWEDERDHPDFAWVPYDNGRVPSSRSSENPYLNYGHLLDHLGDDLERR